MKQKCNADLVAAMTPGVRYSLQEISGLLGTNGSTVSLLLRRAVLDGLVRQAGLRYRERFWIPETERPAGYGANAAASAEIWSVNG